jgi:RNA polymerase sigma factor (sigma-70 family)
MSTTLNAIDPNLVDEVLSLCNRAARWIAHDEQSAEAAANGAAAHILLNRPELLEREKGLALTCKHYTFAAYKREHMNRDARVSMYETEFLRRDGEEDEHADSDLISVFAILRMDGEDNPRAVERIVEFREMRAELDELIDALPPTQARIFRLYLKGYSSDEVAEKLGQPKLSVIKRASKTRKHLRGRKPDLGKYQEFLMSYRPRCKRENYFKRARQGETDRYIRQGKRTHAGYSLPTLL